MNNLTFDEKVLRVMEALILSKEYSWENIPEMAVKMVRLTDIEILKSRV